MGNASKYCKEIGTAFELVAVYLPGTRLKIGDIIQFNKQNLLNNKKGVFKKISSLKDMDIPCTSEVDETVTNYTYTSKGQIQIKTSISVDQIEKTEVLFKTDGSVYMNALDCKVISINNFQVTKKELVDKWNLEENNLFLVTKLVTARKAIIMQSSGKNGNLTFEMTKIPKVPVDKINLKVTHTENHSFIIDAKNNVSVLMDLYEIKMTKTQPSVIDKEKQKIKQPSQTILKVKQAKKSAPPKLATKAISSKNVVAKRDFSKTTRSKNSIAIKNSVSETKRSIRIVKAKRSLFYS